ncbi:MAG: hypothetical protein JWL73_3916 [Actinomycetia bacterium]|nr:hypothetical protein [Actinomycetes bacterium]
MPLASAANATVSAKAATSGDARASSVTGGYQLVASDGGIFSFGSAAYRGSTGALALKQPIVGMAPTATGEGYWLVAADGGVFSFGDAAFHGSTGGIALAKPIVGIATTASGEGYWLVASDGGVFSFGDARYFGSAGGLKLKQPIVGMAATASGSGYWLVASDGGIFSFGDAHYFGSTGGLALNKPIVGMAAPASAAGYWLVASDGGIFSFGDAGYFGSAGAVALTHPIVGMAITPSNTGYWLVASDGGIFSFGDAAYFGSTGATPLNKPVVGMQATETFTEDPSLPATKLAFSTQPATSTGGTAFSVQPTVEIQDATGARVFDNTSDVSIRLTTPAGATLACVGSGTDMTAVAGSAAFRGCAINRPGTYTLTATDGALDGTVSASTTITVGAAAQLAFTAQPSGGVSSTAYSTQPAVTVRDAGGNTVTGNTSAVTLALTTPNGAVIACTANPKNGIAGIATFAGCNTNLVGTYTLTATDGALSAAVSSSFTITPGTATRLGFSNQPSGASSGTVFATQPGVNILDAAGNTVTSNTTSVTIALTTPGGATLICTANPKAAAAGIAMFTNCSVDRVGTYTMTATDGALTSAVSSTFSVGAASASQLAFTTQPSGSTGGAAFGTQPAVTIRDAAGNTVTADTSSVTLALTTPGGATFGCTANPTSPTNGVVTFAGCNVNLAGTYTLTATDGSLASAVSSSFTVTAGTATHLAFTAQPSASTGGAAFATQPSVAVKDAAGNTVTTDVTAVTLDITTPAGATLSCTADPKTAAAGVATFAGCKVDRPGTYTLTATDGSLASAVSSSFTITVGAPAQLAFTTQPSGATGGVAFTGQPAVTVRDAGGNTVSGDVSAITLALTTPAGATLACTANPKNAVAGVASFANCAVDLAGTYTLTATDGSLTSAVSSSFTITVGVPSQLAFTSQPSGATGGVAFTGQPTVTVQDAGHNTVTTDTSATTLELTTPAGATLTCAANPENAVAGVVTFTNCIFDLANTYTLHATDGALTAATSAPLTVAAGPAVSMAFVTQPVGSNGGVAFAQQPEVGLFDAGGNEAANDSSGVTLNLTVQNGGTLSCAANPQPVVAGVASFSNCSIDLADTYTLTASDAGLSDVVSASFTVTVGPAAQLVFTLQPIGAAAGASFGRQPHVTVEDAVGNPVRNDLSSVNLSLTNAAGATLVCSSNPMAVANGIALFTGCSIDTAGTYTLTADDGALTSAVSNTVTIT